MALYITESNEMSGALVNTRKRGRIYVKNCETSENDKRMLSNWFADYN